MISNSYSAWEKQGPRKGEDIHENLSEGKGSENRIYLTMAFLSPTTSFIPQWACLFTDAHSMSRTQRAGVGWVEVGRLSTCRKCSGYHQTTAQEQGNEPPEKHGSASLDQRFFTFRIKSLNIHAHADEAQSPQKKESIVSEGNLKPFLIFSYFFKKKKKKIKTKKKDTIC